MMKLERDESGATAAFGLIVAGVLLVSAAAFGVSMTTRESASAKGQSAELRALAQDTMSLIVDSTGVTRVGNPAWDSSPDDIARFGLASGRGPNFLDGQKILKLRQASMTASANGFPDYAEVRRSLGLPDGTDFHLRSYPIVYAVEDERWRPYRNVALAYVADYVRGGGVESPQGVTITTSAAEGSGFTEVAFDVTCAGPGPTEDVYLFTLRLDTGTGSGSGVITTTHHSPRITCDGVPASFKVRYENLAWAANSAGWELRYDAKSIMSNARLADNALATSLRRAASESYTLTAEADDHNFVEGETPSVTIDKRERDGGRHRVSGISATVKVYPPGVDPDAPGATPALTVTDDLDRNQDTRFVLTGLTPEAGTWNVVATTTDTEARARFTFTTNAMSGANLEPSARAGEEMDLLATLVRDFRPRLQASGDPGDVYRDIRDDTLGLLGDAPQGEGLLASYDIVVIGSDVDTQSIQGQFADDLRGWVDAGGTLIVLGKSGNGAQWLQSANAFSIHMQDPASGSIGTPDLTHPLLTSPDGLRSSDYRSEGRVYRMDGDRYTGFSHVLVDGEPSETESLDVLAISNAGVYGSGTVMLTSLMPTDLFDSGTPEEEALEAKRFMNNLVSRHLSQIHLDYGPAIPTGMAVESVTRLVVVPHPEEPQSLVELHLVLYVWR